MTRRLVIQTDTAQQRKALGWTLDYRIACCLGCIALRREIGEKAQASVVQIDT